MVLTHQSIEDEKQLQNKALKFGCTNSATT